MSLLDTSLPINPWVISTLSEERTQTPTIFATNEISDLLKHIEEETWILCDIDNVLGKTKTHYGSDTWFRWRMTQDAKNGLAQWQSAQMREDLLPVQENTAQVINDLQKGCLGVFAVTSRGKTLASRTIEQLKNVGIDFNQSTTLKGEQVWKTHETSLKENVHFIDGILFMSGQDKGVGLKQIITNSPKKPKKIVFIDDHLKHVNAVDTACQQLGISYIGYHYTRLESWVKEFDQEAAKKHFEALENARLSAKNFGL